MNDASWISIDFDPEFAEGAVSYPQTNRALAAFENSRSLSYRTPIVISDIWRNTGRDLNNPSAPHAVILARR